MATFMGIMFISMLNMHIYMCIHHGWVYGWLGGWVGQWVGSGQITYNLINLDLIKIIQFCLKIYNL